MALTAVLVHVAQGEVDIHSHVHEVNASTHTMHS